MEENKLYAVYHKKLEKGRVFAESLHIPVDQLLIRIANGFLKIRDVHQSQIEVLVQSFKDAGINPTDLVMRAVVCLNGRDGSTSESQKQLEEDIRTGVCEIMPFTGIHGYHAVQKYDLDRKKDDPDHVKQSKMSIHIYDFDKIDMCDAMFVGTKDNEVRFCFCFDYLNLAWLIKVQSCFKILLWNICVFWFHQYLTNGRNNSRVGNVTINHHVPPPTPAINHEIDENDG